MAETFAEDIRAISVMEKLDLTGYLGRDTFGRIYLDTCRTNEEHLKNHVEGKERPGCRKYIEDMFSDGFVGKKVFLAVAVYIEDEKENK